MTATTEGSTGAPAERDPYALVASDGDRRGVGDGLLQHGATSGREPRARDPTRTGRGAAAWGPSSTCVDRRPVAAGHDQRPSSGPRGSARRGRRPPRRPARAWLSRRRANRCWLWPPALVPALRRGADRPCDLHDLGARWSAGDREAALAHEQHTPVGSERSALPQLKAAGSGRPVVRTWRTAACGRRTSSRPLAATSQPPHRRRPGLGRRRVRSSKLSTQRSQPRRGRRGPRARSSAGGR